MSHTRTDGLEIIYEDDDEGAVSSDGTEEGEEEEEEEEEDDTDARTSLHGHPDHPHPQRRRREMDVEASRRERTKALKSENKDLRAHLAFLAREVERADAEMGRWRAKCRRVEDERDALRRELDRLSLATMSSHAQGQRLAMRPQSLAFYSSPFDMDSSSSLGHDIPLQRPSPPFASPTFHGLLSSPPAAFKPLPHAPQGLPGSSSPRIPVHRGRLAQQDSGRPFHDAYSSPERALPVNGQLFHMNGNTNNTDVIPGRLSPSLVSLGAISPGSTISPSSRPPSRTSDTVIQPIRPPSSSSHSSHSQTITHPQPIQPPTPQVQVQPQSTQPAHPSPIQPPQRKSTSDSMTSNSTQALSRSGSTSSSLSRAGSLSTSATSLSRNSSVSSMQERNRLSAGIGMGVSVGVGMALEEGAGGDTAKKTAGQQVRFQVPGEGVISTVDGSSQNQSQDSLSNPSSRITSVSGVRDNGMSEGGGHGQETTRMHPSSLVPTMANGNAPSFTNSLPNAFPQKSMSTFPGSSAPSGSESSTLSLTIPSLVNNLNKQPLPPFSPTTNNGLVSPFSPTASPGVRSQQAFSPTAQPFTPSGALTMGVNLSLNAGARAFSPGRVGGVGKFDNNGQIGGGSATNLSQNPNARALSPAAVGTGVGGGIPFIPPQAPTHIQPQARQPQLHSQQASQASSYFSSTQQHISMTHHQQHQHSSALNSSSMLPLQAPILTDDPDYGPVIVHGPLPPRHTHSHSHPQPHPHPHSHFPSGSNMTGVGTVGGSGGGLRRKREPLNVPPRYLGLGMGVSTSTGAAAVGAVGTGGRRGSAGVSTGPAMGVGLAMGMGSALGAGMGSGAGIGTYDGDENGGGAGVGSGGYGW